MSTGEQRVNPTSAPTGLAHEVGKRRPFEHPQEEVYLNLVRTTERLRERFEVLFKQHAISDAQYNVLRILRGHGEAIPSGTVARQMVSREPDITRLLDRMAKSGLIERVRSSVDRRVVLARLTDAGRELLHTLDPLVRRLHHEQCAHMSDADLRTLIGLLERARAPFPGTV